jgi:hypothetical protein
VAINVRRLISETSCFFKKVPLSELKCALPHEAAHISQTV